MVKVNFDVNVMHFGFKNTDTKLIPIKGTL